MSKNLTKKEISFHSSFFGTGGHLSIRNIRRLIKKHPNDLQLQELLKIELAKI